MNKKERREINYIVLVLIVMVVIFSVIRICSNTTKNVSLSMSGGTDERIQVVDERYIELKFDAPIAGLTGFSFWFEGDYANFKDSGFMVTVAIENDPLNPQMLYERIMPLAKQSFDRQDYIVIVPFEGDVQQGDHLRIAIMGMGMSQEDGIFIKTSSQSNLEGAIFEVNDFVQENTLGGALYYQTKELKIFPVLIQGIIVILLILLAEELLKKPKREKKYVKREPIPLKKRIMKLIPVIIFLIVVLDYTYYSGIRPQLQNPELLDKAELNTGKNTIFREVCDGEILFFTNWIAEDRFMGFGVHLKEPYADDGILTVEVTDVDSQDLVVSAQKAIYELPKAEGDFLKFCFGSPVKKSAGKEYLISIYYSGTRPIEFLGDGSEENNPELIPLYQRNSYLNILFFLLSILILGFTSVFYLCEQNQMKVERLLFISVIFLGILFELVITPFSIPDESAHIDTAYRMSNQILGVEDTKIKDGIYKRECDIYLDSGLKARMNVENYKWIYDDLLKSEGTRSSRLTYAADVTPNANELYLLLPALCITVGRILGIGFLPMIFLARTVNLLFAAWMIYLSVKKLPFGKSILCVVALLPLTLQQIASCSYDVLIVAVSMLYVSYCVYTIYSKEKLERSDILIIAITATMLGICKGGVYTPLYLLGVWGLVKRGYIRLPQSKKMRIAGRGLVSGMVLVGIIGMIYMFRQPADLYKLKSGQYSLAYLVQHPWRTVRIFESTLYESIYSYFRQIVGEGLGYFQISLKFILPVGYALLLGEAVICNEKYPYVLNTQDKCVFLGAAILSFIAVHMAFLISSFLVSSASGDELIGGVQGRYFIPMLWLMLISFRSGRIVNKRKGYKKIVTVGYAMGIAAVTQVVIDVLGTPK